MINCDLAKELINQELDNELNSDLNNQLEGHLSECDSCYLYHQELLKLHNNLLKLPDIKLSTSIVDSLVAEEKLVAPNTSSKFTFRKLNIWHGLIAAAIIAIVYIPVSGLINNGMDYSLNSEDAPYLAMEDQQRAGEIGSEKMLLPESSPEDNSTALQIQPTQEYGINSEESVEKSPELTEGTKESDALTQESENYALVSGASIDYRVEMVDNQLIIYDSSNNEVFVSTQWDDKYTVKWNIEETLINYQLFDENSQIVAKYRIDLVEKKEEIIN